MAASNNGTVQELTVEETGTTYSVKISIKAVQVSGAAGDIQKIDLWVLILAAGGSIPSLLTDDNLETINGFFVGSLYPADGDFSGADDRLLEKFRFRRKVDRNQRIFLAATSQAIQGTERTVDLDGIFSYVLRVR